MQTITLCCAPLTCYLLRVSGKQNSIWCRRSHAELTSMASFSEEHNFPHLGLLVTCRPGIIQLSEGSDWLLLARHMSANPLQLCLTFMTLWTVAHQAPLCMGFSRREYWSGVLCPTPGHLPDPGVELASLMSPALARRFFTTSTTVLLLSVDKLQGSERNN